MKQLVYILLSLIFVVSCTSNTIYKKPDDLIPEDKMVDLLVDLQLALGAKSIKNIEGKKNIDYMHLVYEKYQIDSARFAESNFYYMSDIDKFNKILKKSKNKLQKMKNEYKALKKNKDSVKNPSRRELREMQRPSISSKDTTLVVN